MSDKKHLRKKLFINAEVQGAILHRTVLHWFFYLAAILLTTVIIASLKDPSKMAIRMVFQSFVYFSPAIIASIVLLPLIVYDMLRESNRVAGPIYRLEKEMTKLRKGQKVKELRFRDGDHWSDLAVTFSQMAAAHQANLEQIESLKKQLAEKEAPAV
ncbi:MAG: hypothetical protein AAF623_04930 [Planctomycetota bacterium]